MNVSVIDEKIRFGRFLLSVLLKHPPILTSMSSSCLPPLNIVDRMPIATELALPLMRRLYLFYSERFRKSRDREDLDVAIGLARICIATKASNNVQVDEYHMCRMLLHEYEITLHHGTITEAIKHGRASLQGAYIDDPCHLFALTYALCTRSVRYDTPEDLESSVRLMESTLLSAEKKGMTAAEIHDIRIALELTLRKQRIRNPRFTEVGVGNGESTTLEIEPHFDVDGHGRLLVQLSTIDCLDDPQKFKETISLCEAALNNEVDFQQRISGKQWLATRLFGRFLRLKTIDDLERSIQLEQDTHDECGDVRSGLKGGSIARLGMMYWKRYKLLRNPLDLEASQTYFSNLTDENLVSTKDQFSYSHVYAREMFCEGRYEDAVKYYRKALDIFPRLLMVGRDRRIKKPTWDKLGARAAAASVECGQYWGALELLEQARSIEWNRGLQMRSTLDKLANDHPDYAESFKELSESLEKVELMKSTEGDLQNGMELAGLHEAPWEQRFSLSQRWDSLLAEIRRLPGYDNFLAAPRFEQLKCVSEEGPVVVINMDNYRSHAFILTHSTLDRPEIVCLPDDILRTLAQWSVEMIEGIVKVDDGSVKEADFNRHVITPILKKLWLEIVRPIRVSLNHLAPYARRIWWCPTDLLTHLPLHVVTNGIGSKDKGQFSRLIPSYTITLSSLIRARERLTVRKNVGILAVSCEQPLDSNYQKISGASKEIQLLQAVPTVCRITTLEGSDATVEKVCLEMSRHSWLHLSCHGVQSFDEPLRSHFALHDGPLRMADIIATRPANPEFAFLSACETAFGTTMFDEAMHLAAGLHFVGFRATIATMWSVGDKTAKRLAKEVYKVLLRDPEREPDVEETAEALWQATEILKRKGVLMSRLAPFIHIGV